MARTIHYISSDEAPIERQGVKERESDGFTTQEELNLPPEDALRAAKGDLGWQHVPHFEPKPLTSPGVPFKNLRGGK